MAKLKPVEMTIAVFEIQPLTEGTQIVDLPKILYTVLNKTKTAKERLMPLNADENSKDSDFIGSFNYNQGFLFCSFIRLNEGEESTVLFTSLEKKTVEINEIIVTAQEGSAGSVRDKAFFCMCGNLMVMSSSKNNRGALETYINWILCNNLNDSQQCKFVPRKNTADTVPIKDISSIQFLDTYLNGKQDIQKTSLQLKKGLLQSLLNDVATIRDFDIQDIISATLLLRINKKQLKKNNSAVLDTALRLVDNENVIITGKQGRRIKGTQYLIRVVKKFERTAASYYNERAIETAMREIIKAVRDGQVVF